MDEHLVPLGGDWALRRDFAVRSAGFPVAGLGAFGAENERARLREIAADPAFREALTWQNRGVLATAVDGLRKSREASSTMRDRFAPDAVVRAADAAAGVPEATRHASADGKSGPLRNRERLSGPRTLLRPDVVLMDVRGRSNREIAHELVVSEATVKTHVHKIFSKLDVRDRVQAVVLAYETGLAQPGASTRTHAVPGVPP